MRRSRAFQEPLEKPDCDPALALLWHLHSSSAGVGYSRIEIVSTAAMIHVDLTTMVYVISIGLCVGYRLPSQKLYGKSFKP